MIAALIQTWKVWFKSAAVMKLTTTIPIFLCCLLHNALAGTQTSQFNWISF
jgi:hypothetical protein